MSVETDFYTAVTGDATIGGLISTRCYPVQAPLIATWPAVVYSVISQVPFAKLCLQTRIQTDIYAESYATVKSLRDALVTLTNANAGWTYVGGPDAYETNEGLYHQPVDVTIIHSVS